MASDNAVVDVFLVFPYGPVGPFGDSAWSLMIFRLAGCQGALSNGGIFEGGYLTEFFQDYLPVATDLLLR